MAGFVPNEERTRKQMLAEIGLNSLEDLYRDIPESVRLDHLDIPEGLTEMEAEASLQKMAGKNRVFRDIYRGAGAYRHYIPAIVRRVPQKETFLSSYTPYQAEMSQGILQIIFEFQTEVSELFGLPCANASLYDGATAAAEALQMTRSRKVTRTLISETADPQYIEVCRTYAYGQGLEPVLIPAKDGYTDPDALRELLLEPTAGVFIPQVNYYGLIEESEAQSKIIHEAGALFILGVLPHAAAVLPSAGEVGADIAVAEGQPLGLPLSFGGPYVGLMACQEKLLRKMPGRIVGQTTDLEENRAFVLTLQTREQHIRREKATSNICTNQALCALTVTVYLAALGKQGLIDVANRALAKAHYLQGQLESIGFPRLHRGEFFHEFVTKCPVSAKRLNERLAEAEILGPLGIQIPGTDEKTEALLWCVTEMNTLADMERLVEILREVQA